MLGSDMTVGTKNVATSFSSDDVIGARPVRICVITASEFARTHGTGAQLLKIYDGSQRYWHLYWHSFHGTESEVQRSSKLSVLPVAIPRLGRASRLFMQACGLAWWYGEKVNKLRFRLLLRHKGPFDVAHVVVADEVAASRATSLLLELDCPFVLQIYDITHDAGLNSRLTPRFADLVRNASDVFALTAGIRREAEKFRDDVQMIGIGADLIHLPEHAGLPSDELRIVITGRPYHGGAALLAESLEELNSTFKAVQINYIGAHFCDLPETLRACAVDHGFCESDEDYLRLLSTMSIAFLTGPDRDDCLGKYSFPSRATDLCMAGLPIVACVPKASATAEFFVEQETSFFRRVESAPQLVEACRVLSFSEQAGHESRQFAEREFDVRTHRQRVLSAVEDAAL